MTAYTFTGEIRVGGWGIEPEVHEVMVTLYTDEPLPEDLGVTVATTQGRRWRPQVVLSREDSG